jgi:anti-sigma factor RsiW
MTDQQKLDCREIFALLSEYIDEELPPATCEEIAQHIEGCTPCVDFVESLKKAIEVSRKAELPDRPTPLPDATREQLRTLWQRMLASRV